MSSYISKFGLENRHESLYTDTEIDINSEYSKEYNQESEDTIFDNILECYSENFIKPIEKRNALLFKIPPQSINVKPEKNYPERSNSCSYNYSKKSSCNSESKKSSNSSLIVNNSSGSYQIDIFFRKSFDIINKTKNINSRINTWKLKQEYKKKINKNIFCSGIPKQELFNEFKDGTLTIMYHFESWNNYNGLFGGYRNKRGDTYIFYMYQNELNMYIDLMSEDLNKDYIKYFKTLQNKILGPIYYKEKFNIKDSFDTKQDIFALVEDIKDEFLLRNCI